jgi:hypothetical protein
MLIAAVSGHEKNPGRVAGVKSREETEIEARDASQ